MTELNSTSMRNAIVHACHSPSDPYFPLDFQILERLMGKIGLAQDPTASSGRTCLRRDREESVYTCFATGGSEFRTSDVSDSVNERITMSIAEHTLCDSKD